MATHHQVKQYLAYWFQLGKKLCVNGGRDEISPQTVIVGDRYSPEFEQCWKYVLSPESGDCYLEGTHQTVRELLSPQWEVNPCARCDMPIPVASRGLPSESCPCSDLPTWPSLDIPTPRAPVSSNAQLIQIRDRLVRVAQKSAASDSQSQAS